MNNPSAYPVLDREGTNLNGDCIYCNADAGMTLLDYFAGQALTGFCSGGLQGESPSTVAQLSYKLADSMIRTRELVLAELSAEK